MAAAPICRISSGTLDLLARGTPGWVNAELPTPSFHEPGGHAIGLQDQERVA